MKKFDPKNYNITKKQIGRGGIGVVFLGNDKRTNQSIAIKYIDKPT
jgi:hypothetical protein